MRGCCLPRSLREKREDFRIVSDMIVKGICISG